MTTPTTNQLIATARAIDGKLPRTISCCEGHLFDGDDNEYDEHYHKRTEPPRPLSESELEQLIRARQALPQLADALEEDERILGDLRSDVSDIIDNKDGQWDCACSFDYQQGHSHDCPVALRSDVETVMAANRLLTRERDASRAEVSRLVTRLHNYGLRP